MIHTIDKQTRLRISGWYHTNKTFCGRQNYVFDMPNLINPVLELAYLLRTKQTFVNLPRKLK